MPKPKTDKPQPAPAKSNSKEKLVKKKPKNKEGLLIKVTILSIANLFCLGGLLFLLLNLSEKAQEVKILRNTSLASLQLDTDALRIELSNNKPKLDKLFALFPATESDLLEFINEIDKLKSEGLVTSFSFASNRPVKDRTGFGGLPIIIEFRGSWNQIDWGLKRLESLPFMIRAINLEIRQLSEGEVSLKYGGILYVDEKFASN